MFHPWRALRALGHVVVVWARPHPAVPAATNGIDIIWLDPRMTQSERRCALAHELAHLEDAHRGCQPRAIEHEVRARVARWLVSHEQLVNALPWSMSLEELAEELWVTPMVAADRLGGLTHAERADLAARLPEHRDL